MFEYRQIEKKKLLHREVVATPRCRDSKIFQQTVVLQIRQKQRTKLT